MKKLLITGASGFLGWHLCQLAQKTWQVFGTHHTQAIALPLIPSIPLDPNPLSPHQRHRSLPMLR